MEFSSKFIVAIELIVMLIVPAFHGQVESATSRSITSDKEALISFKSRVTAEAELPNPLSSWEESLSPCNWTGVSCDEPGQRVVGIRLSGLRMTGSLSPHLGNLSFLRSLELQNNELSGDLPHQLGNLIQLRTLDISFNSIRGSIPSNLSRCKDLRELDLMQNQISGEVPLELGFLQNLQILNLARNQLSGNFPSSLANISSLVDLNLGTNKFGGPIPGDLRLLTKLKYLDLTINSLTGTVPPSIYNMSSLVYLALASNDLGGELPGDLAVTLPNLLRFNFCFNKFTGTIPRSLHNLTNINIIRMAHNLLHGSVPPGLGNLPHLEMYNIRFNAIVGGFEFLELLTNSTRLNFLAIDGNLLKGTIPNSIGNLSKVLTKFYMGGNDIYGSIPSSISELPALELLDLGDGSISGEIPSEIGLLKELRVLRLANNAFSGTIPDSLGNLKVLTKIDLSKNKLVGSVPTTFGNFQSLIFMDLSENNLNGTIPTELFNLPILSYFLNLSRNELTGTLPREIELLGNVAIINISDNKISGSIPSSLGNCKSLEQLLLARNTLSGVIPNTLVNVRGLETLDLSSNQLSGEIPSNLRSLRWLQLLNLSYNNLVGEIPTTGIFADPSKVHLEENEGLCMGFLCRKPHVRGRRLRLVYIVASVAVVISLSFIIGLIWYVRRGKKMLKKGSVEPFVKSRPPMISYNELKVATDNFSEDNLVGSGSFGYVYKGILQGGFVAVKVLDAAIARSRKSFEAECEALRNVRHRNLVKLMTVCSSSDSKNEEFLAMIFEFMSNGSLDDWISGKRRHANKTRFKFLERLRCLIGIASAIDYLHNESETPIVHCDLKPSNILLDSDMTAKVADFGLAKLLLDANNQISISSTHTLKGSIGYIPPEYGYGVMPSTTGDVYSFGILVLELFSRRSPTHEMFGGGRSLRSWVEDHFPTSVEKVLDLELVEEMKNESHQSQSQRDCLVKVIGVGLSCAAESPDARITIRDALRKLSNTEQLLQKFEFANVD